MKAIKPQEQAIPHPCGRLYWAIPDRRRTYCHSDRRGIDSSLSGTIPEIKSSREWAPFRPKPGTNDGAGQVDGGTPSCILGTHPSTIYFKWCWALVPFENKIQLCL